MARLYLGLTVVRTGEQENGFHQAVAGLTGIHDRLEYIEAHLLQGIFWNPAREIRSEIATLIAPSTGERMEREIDLARRDEQISRNRDG